MTEPLLLVRGLTVRLPDGDCTELVSGVSFDVEACCSHALVGASGAGKSTVAYALLGLLPAGVTAAGSICFEQRELLGAPAALWRSVRGRRLGFMPQEPLAALDPVRSIGAQLIETIRTHFPVSRGEARGRAVAMLGELGVRMPAERLAAYPFELSGGERQRVLLALALAGEPVLLVADEPTSALDVTSRSELVGLLARERARRRLALLLITHDLTLLPDLVDTVAVMHGGRLAETGPTADILRAPASEPARELVRLARARDHARARNHAHALETAGSGLNDGSR